MDLSIVIPIYNEEENIASLYVELKEVLKGLGGESEIIFVNDGSTDGSLEALSRLKCSDPAVRIISFRRNFGQTAALEAGFKASKGDYIVTLDGDLQNNPKDIPKILMGLKEADMVCGWRHKRKDPILKRLPSKISNALARWLTGLKIHDSGCTLRGYRKEAVKGIRLYGEMHRYLPAIIASKGFLVKEAKVHHRKRQAGKTKYGARRLMKGFLDLLFIKFWSDYSTRPVHFFGSLGLLCLLAGFLIGSYKVLVDFLYLGNPLDLGPALLLSVLLIVVGVQIVLFGFMTEVQARTYYESQGLNHYEVAGENDVR